MTEEAPISSAAPPSLVTNTALAAFVIGMLTVIQPAYNAIQQMRQVSYWWAAPLLLVAVLFSLTLPAFYFALYRGGAEVSLREPLRLPALLAALLLALLTLVAAGMWVAALMAQSNGTVLGDHPSPFTGANILDLALQLGGLANAAVLYALYRQRIEARESAPSKELRVVTTMTVVIWGLALLFLLARVAIVPLLYSPIKTQAQATGHAAPTMIGLFAEAMHVFVLQGCLAAAPFLLWFSIRREKASAALVDAPAVAVEEASQPVETGEQASGELPGQQS